MEEYSMANVTKWNGSTEPFNRAKIEKSIRNAGMDEAAARNIAKEIPERDFTTAELRKTITQHIRESNQEAADRYEGTARLVARKSVQTAKGVARMTQNTLNRMKIKVGETVNLAHGEKKHSVKVEANTQAKEREIHLHNEDLRTVGAEEGSRINTHRRV